MTHGYHLVRARTGARAHVLRGRLAYPPPPFGRPLCRLFDGPWSAAADDVPLCRVCVARAVGTVEGAVLLNALENPLLDVLAANAEREP